MAQLKSLLQALPSSFRARCNSPRHTRISAYIFRRLQPRPVVLYAGHASVTSYRPLSTSRATQSTITEQPREKGATDDISFATGQPADLPDRALKLLDTWDLSSSNKGLSRQFIFTGFSKAWTFMSLVADECKAQKHHPSWSNLYNKVTIEWTTHKPEGLSIKDVEMAEFCDRKANEIGLKK